MKQSTADRKEIVEEAGRKLFEAKMLKKGTPVQAILEAVRKSKEAKEARARRRKKKPEQLNEPQEPMIVMDVDELMKAMENDEIELTDVDESITAMEVVTKELANWSIKPGSLGYKTVISVVEDFSAEALGHKPTPDEIVDVAAKRFKTKRTSIISALTKLVKKAKFENSAFIPILIKLPKDQITWDIVLNEVADFAE